MKRVNLYDKMGLFSKKKKINFFYFKRWWYL